MRTKAFSVRRSLKGLRSLLNESLNANGIVFEHYFEQSSKLGLRARRKVLNCTKATGNAFHTCGSLQVSRSQSDFVRRKHSVVKKWS